MLLNSWNILDEDESFLQKYCYSIEHRNILIEYTVYSISIVARYRVK